MHLKETPKYSNRNLKIELENSIYSKEYRFLNEDEQYEIKKKINKCY